jgi:hypothetical protein
MAQWKPILVKSLLDSASDQQSGVLQWSDLTLLQNEFYDVTAGNVGDMDGGGLNNRLLAVTDAGAGGMVTSWQDIYVHPPYSPSQGIYSFSIDIGNTLTSTGSVDLSLLDTDPGTSADSTYSYSAAQIAAAVSAGDMDMFHQNENWQDNGGAPAGNYPTAGQVSDLASNNVVSMGVLKTVSATLLSNADGHVTATTALADGGDDAAQAAAYGADINIGQLPVCVGNTVDAYFNCTTEGNDFTGDYNANDYSHKIYNTSTTAATQPQLNTGANQGVTNDPDWSGDLVRWEVDFLGGPLSAGMFGSPTANSAPGTALSVNNRVRIITSLTGGVSNEETGHSQKLTMLQNNQGAHLQDGTNWLVVDEPAGHISYDGSIGTDSYFELEFEDIDVDDIPAAAAGVSLACGGADAGTYLCLANQYGSYQTTIDVDDRLDTADREADQFRWWNLEVTGDYTGGGAVAPHETNTYKTVNDIAVHGANPDFHFSGDDGYSDLVDEFNIKGHTGIGWDADGRQYDHTPASGTERMDTPITVLHNASATAFTSGVNIIDGTETATLITISGIYGDNNRVKTITSGVGMDFPTIDSGTNQTGPIHVGMPSTLTSLSTNSTAQISGTTHSHEIPTTHNGSDPENGVGEYRMVLRTTHDETDSIVPNAGSLILEDLLVRGSYSEGVADSDRVLLIAGDTAIADQVIQLNVQFNQLDDTAYYCSNTTSGDGTTGYQTQPECVQTDGDCVCADGLTSCDSGGTGTDYATCAGYGDYIGYGDGTGGASDASEWVSDYLWVTTEVTSYGALFNTLGELATGVIFGNDENDATTGGFTFFGNSSPHSTGAGDEYWGAGAFTPLYFKDIVDGDLSYKGVELGNVTWTSNAYYSDNDVPTVIYGSDGYVAVLGSSNGLNGASPNNTLTDGVLLVKDDYDGGANAGELWINPQVASQVSSWANYYTGYDDINSETGTGYNLAMGIGEQGNDGDGSAIVAGSGGYLQCQYLTLGDVGDVMDSTAGQESIANMIDNQGSMVNGMIVAKYAAGGVDGSLFLLVNES